MSQVCPASPMPPQSQPGLPGSQTAMNPVPVVCPPNYQGSAKLKNKVAIITGGDSGIGRSVAVLFAKEGADCVISYLNEHDDAEATVALVEAEGRKCIAVAGDIGELDNCQKLVDTVIKEFGKIDIVVNNAAEHHEQKELTDITVKQLERTFRTNVFSYFYLTQAALPHLKAYSCIIKTASVVAYRGSPALIDYAATKGAIVAFTRSLATNLAPKHIRVNGVAPGPIWTPLIPATFDAEKVSHFGEDVALARPGQPAEVATSYVFLASDDASYMTGQFLHPNGGEIVNA